MDDLRGSILEYVRREYLEEDDDRPLTETTRLISGTARLRSLMVRFARGAPR